MLIMYVMYVMYAFVCVCVMCVCYVCYVMLCYVTLRYVMLCYVCMYVYIYIYIYMNACKYIYIYACKIMQIYYRQISVPLETASLFHLFGDDGDCVIIYISHIYIYIFISMLFLLHHPSISHSGSTITGLPPTKTGCQMAPPMDFGRHALW